MKGTPVKSTKALKSGFAPFEEIVPAGTAGYIMQAGKNAFGEMTILVRFDGFAPVACKREEIEATG